MCEFCYEFNIVKDLNKANPKEGYSIKYYSCFGEAVFYKQIYSGTTLHRAHKLKFCPECGKEFVYNVNL